MSQRSKLEKISKKSNPVENTDDDILEIDLEKEQEEFEQISNDITVRYAKKKQKIFAKEKRTF